MRKGDTIPFFRWSRSSSRIALGDTSEPVPAVVGRQANQSPFCLMNPVPKQSSTSWSLLIKAAINFVTSSTEPPPTPTTLSALNCRATSKIFLKSLTVGSATMSWNTSMLTPALFSSASVSSMSGRIGGAVSTKRRWSPIFL